ncbi:MAG: NADPH-dependent FMN reductase [Candidatus Kariarchaeaceae archaeon]|jgi:NAD(P)H-dependent FMN reductase
MDNPRIIGIVGSLRSGSYTKKVVQIALDAAREMGAQTELIDLAEYHLLFPFQVPRDEMPDDVSRLKEKIASAQGVILGTPEYHGSFSGVIKNMLDLMGFAEFEGKMIGLVGVGGGALGAINALNGLRAIGRQLHAWVIPEQASLPNVSSHFEGEELTDERLVERIRTVGRQVTRFSVLHNSRQIDQFMKEWETAPKNPGME